MALEKVIIGIAKNVLKNCFKFNESIDVIIRKFDDGCPIKEELLALNAQKNQIQSALQPISSAITGIDKTVTVLDGLLTGLDIAVTIIKALPFPVAVPPGAGIPANVLTKLANTLVILSALIKYGKGQTAVGKALMGPCGDAIQGVLDKLSELEGKILECMDKLIEDELEWSPVKDYEESNKVSQTQFFIASNSNNGILPTSGENASNFWGISDNVGHPDEWDSEKSYYNGDKVKVTEYYEALEENKNKKPSENPSVWNGVSEDQAKQDLIDDLTEELNFTLAQTGESSNVEDNVLSEEELINTLTTLPGLYYKGFYIRMEYDQNNSFSFPKRRIYALKVDQNKIQENQIFPENEEIPEGLIEETLYNEYSFSSSVEVLLNEMKFRIDTYGIDINLNLIPIPPPPPAPDEKEIQRSANVTQIQITTYGDWQVGDMKLSWANELYDRAWDKHLEANEQGPGHWLYDKAQEEGITTLQQSIKSYVWLFQTGRINLVSWIKDIFKVPNMEIAQAMFDEAYSLGRKGLKNATEYDPQSGWFLHTVKQAVRAKRFVNDAWQEGVNLERQAAYEVGWQYWKVKNLLPDMNSDSWPGASGKGPDFSNNGDTSRVKLGQYTNAAGQTVELPNGSYYVNDYSKPIAQEGFTKAQGGSLSTYREVKDNDNPGKTELDTYNNVGPDSGADPFNSGWWLFHGPFNVGKYPGEQEPRITKDFRAWVFKDDTNSPYTNKDAWVEVTNPNAPWL